MFVCVVLRLHAACSCVYNDGSNDDPNESNESNDADNPNNSDDPDDDPDDPDDADNTDAAETSAEAKTETQGCVSGEFVDELWRNVLTCDALRSRSSVLQL